MSEEKHHILIDGMTSGNLEKLQKDDLRLPSFWKAHREISSAF